MDMETRSLFSRIALATALTLPRLVTGCDAGPARPEDPPPDPACTGTCPPLLVGRLLPPAGHPSFYWMSLSVEPSRRRLYAYGARFDVSNPGAVRIAGLPKAGPTAVDPNTGRYVTTDEGSKTFFVYNANDTLYDQQAITGTIFAIDVDATRGLFFISTRADDQLVVYGEGARQILARDPLDRPPLAPVFDSSTDKTYVNQFLPSAPVSL